MPINSYGPLASNNGLEVVFNERERDVSAIAQLETGKLQGRYRNVGAIARDIPTSSTDIVSGDAEGDIVYNGSTLYICLNISNSLAWRSITLASF